MIKDATVRKCGIGKRFCICPIFPCHRLNKYLTWFTFANKSYPIASTGDIDLADSFTVAEIVLTIVQAEREQETGKVLEMADKTITEAKIAMAEGKKLLGGW